MSERAPVTLAGIFRSFFRSLHSSAEKATQLIPWRPLFFFQFSIRQLRSNLIRWAIGSFVRWTTNRAKELSGVHFTFCIQFRLHYVFFCCTFSWSLYHLRLRDKVGLKVANVPKLFLSFSGKHLKLGLDSLPLHCNLFFTYRLVTNAVQSCVSESVTKATTIDEQNTKHST
jgi:hypothetical protein